MKCPVCSGRKFRIVSYAYETVEYNEYNNIITSDNDLELGDIIDEKGYLCLGCNNLIKSEYMIRHEFHISI